MKTITARLTKEQFDKIKFRFVSELNMGNEHAITLESVDFIPKILLCSHVPFKDGSPKGRCYTHYMIDGNIFKTKTKAIEYLNKIRATNEKD